MFSSYSVLSTKEILRGYHVHVQLHSAWFEVCAFATAVRYFIFFIIYLKIFRKLRNSSRYAIIS